MKRSTGWRRIRGTSRGFTLTELMAVVVIMGILAALAVVGYRKYVNSARTSEATQMVGSIRAAQEAYRSETLSYLNVSTSIDTYYPSDPAAGTMPQVVQWGGNGNDVARWRMLNVTTSAPVHYGYACVAGLAGTQPPALSNFDSAPTWPNPTVEPWFLIQAKGNLNGDSILSYYAESSFTTGGSWMREGE